uniref:Homeobox domain-containing protein n=1 Tax=Meloidogyne incognita TaxID=6306 RepID=A0A914LYK6_MELIC
MMLSDANFFDLKEEQVKLFKQIYGQDQRPNTPILQQLVEATGLNIRIVRAWFQNERRKDRKKVVEERRRQEKERKRQQKKLSTQKTPKEDSSSSDLTESDSTITSGDCSSSSSNSSEDSSDADDNKNIKNPSATTEQIKLVEKSVCSTSQQQQTSKQNPQQYKKNSKGCIYCFLFGAKAEINSTIEQQSTCIKFCGTHNSSILLLSAALNDNLLDDKQKIVINQPFREGFKADYNEKNNGTKVIGVNNFDRMNLKLLLIKTSLQLDIINLCELEETSNLSLQKECTSLGITWQLHSFKLLNCKGMFLIGIEV